MLCLSLLLCSGGIRYAIVSTTVATEGIEPPASIFHVEKSLPAEINLQNLERQADVYIQMLSVKLDALWYLCVRQLRHIAAVRAAKRPQVLQAFAHYARLDPSSQKQLEVAPLANMKSNLIQVGDDQIAFAFAVSKMLVPFS